MRFSRRKQRRRRQTLRGNEVCGGGNLWKSASFLYVVRVYRAVGPIRRGVALFAARSGPGRVLAAQYARREEGVSGVRRGCIYNDAASSVHEARNGDTILRLAGTAAFNKLFIQVSSVLTSGIES